MFNPDQDITRAEFAAIMVRGLGLKLENGSSPFADANEASEWAKNSIADCLQAGIVAGRNATQLAPKAYISRAEVAAIVQRLLQKSELI